jgi:hypothetical protein
MIKHPVNLLLLAFALLGGCVGARTFHDVARAGDTVALAAGWKQHFRRDNTTVIIYPSAGTPIVYPPNHPGVRGIINLYPDPVSSLIVSDRTGQDLTPSAQSYAQNVNTLFTSDDNDWWETTIFLDLPGSLPAGATALAVSNPFGETSYSFLEIVPGTGKKNAFSSTIGDLTDGQIGSLERVAHYTVKFAGNTVPFAIQIDMSHAPDVDHGGSGRPHVANPRGDMKNIAWSDTGTSLRAIITPAKAQPLGSLLDYKFYVTGGITGLSVVSVKAFDINGNPVSGITASLAY